MKRKTTMKLEAKNQEVTSSSLEKMTTTVIVSLMPTRNNKARSLITNKSSSHTIETNFRREAIR